MSYAKRASKKYRKVRPFVKIEHRMLDSDNYRNLTNKAIKLLFDVWRQYNGFNNGDLCVAWSVMEPKGWRSKETLYRALKELVYYEFIELTRQGGKNRCSLYALTCFSIDDCKGKLDVPSTQRASHRWKKPKPRYSPSPSAILPSAPTARLEVHQGSGASA